jgi:cyanophycinase
MRLALIGGEEFADGFEDVHAGLLAELGGGPKRIVFLPTCAADDGDEAIDHWCAAARENLSAIGARVETPRVVDAAGANDPRHAQLVAEADWIYFGGGYPHVAMRILANSRVLAAAQSARARGALVSGSSGGAMLMCARSWVITREFAAEVSRVWATGAPPDWDPPMAAPVDCLNLIPRSICAPHYNRLFPHKWLERGYFRGWSVIGIDEQTALVSDGQAWEVRGRGAVTLIRDDLKPARYAAGERVVL